MFYQIGQFLPKFFYFSFCILSQISHLFFEIIILIFELSTQRLILSNGFLHILILGVEIANLGDQKGILLLEVFIFVPEYAYKLIGNLRIRSRVLPVHHKFVIVSSDCLVWPLLRGVSVLVGLDASAAVFAVQRGLGRVLDEADVQLVDRRTVLHLRIAQISLSYERSWQWGLSTGVRKCGTAVQLRVHTQIQMLLFHLKANSGKYLIEFKFYVHKDHSNSPLKPKNIERQLSVLNLITIIQIMRSTEQDLLERVRTSLESKYNSSLFFYCSKDIVKYLRSKTTTHEVALFHDYYYWDYVEQFMKRFYKQNEAQERILLLEDYFRNSRMYPEQLPRLLTCRPILYKRTKRRLKNLKRMDEYYMTAGAMQPKDEDFVVEVQSQELDAVIHEGGRREEEVSYETEPYDIYDGPEEDGRAQGNAVFEIKRVPTLPFLAEDGEDPDEEVDTSEISHLIMDFKTMKIPLIDFNSIQQRHSISSKQSLLKESIGLEFRGKGQTIRQLKAQVYNHRTSKHPAKPSGKKVYFVKGLRQRQNQVDWGTDKVLHEYFPQKRRTIHDDTNNNSNSISNSNRPSKKLLSGLNGSANRTPTSNRLHQLREKLKSLQSRSSGLSQRISSLMTERDHRKKVDYAELIAKIKGSSSHGKMRKVETLREVQSSEYLRVDKNIKEDKRAHDKGQSSLKQLHSKQKIRTTNNLLELED